jgi:hypothetical protein
VNFGKRFTARRAPARGLCRVLLWTLFIYYLWVSCRLLTRVDIAVGNSTTQSAYSSTVARNLFSARRNASHRSTGAISRRRSNGTYVVMRRFARKGSKSKYITAPQSLFWCGNGQNGSGLPPRCYVRSSTSSCSMALCVRHGCCAHRRVDIGPACRACDSGMALDGGGELTRRECCGGCSRCG